MTREFIVREKGYLYYIGKDGYLWRTPTKLNPTGTRAKVGTEKIPRVDGYMYFLDKRGFVARAKMKSEPETRAGLACPPGPYDVESGQFQEIGLDVEKEEKVRGRLFEIDGQDFDWVIVDERNSVGVHQREDYRYEVGNDHVTADLVNWRVPRGGPWYLILEIPYRQNPRSVRVELKREPRE
ncbi:MAG: hypothetical protein ACHQ2Y_02335 [Candidatus Lutacidiplasmatales archaeon]